jgi:hypothetical protein
MNPELRALLTAWRDDPSRRAEAVVALVAAGLVGPDDALEDGDAAAWLEVLDEVPLGLGVAAAVRSAGDAAIDRAFDPSSVRVGDAVASAARAAGGIDLADAVLAAVAAPEDALPEGWIAGLLDHALPPELHERAARAVAADAEVRADVGRQASVGRRLREAVEAEAGATPAVWPAVSAEMGLADPETVPGWDGARLRRAVVEAAGTVDVRDGVLESVRRDARAPIPDEPEPMNRGWIVTAFVVAAAAAALVAVAPWLVLPANEAPLFVERPMDFASTSEMNVDEVRYGENASVFVDLPAAEGEPVIIWVDDGARL